MAPSRFGHNLSKPTAYRGCSTPCGYVIQVLHGASNDVTWLQRDFRIYLVNIFDTASCCQVADSHVFGAHAHVCSIQHSTLDLRLNSKARCQSTSFAIGFGGQQQVLAAPAAGFLQRAHGQELPAGRLDPKVLPHCTMQHWRGA
jgi:3'-5' exonuclease